MASYREKKLDASSEFISEIGVEKVLNNFGDMRSMTRSARIATSSVSG